MMIGWFKGEFSIKLKEIATPFAETASRPVLIPLMQKLEREIKRLLQLDIIERVDDAIEWVAPIVVVPTGEEIRL